MGVKDERCQGGDPRVGILPERFLPWVTHPSREGEVFFSPDDTLMEEVTEFPR
jgi:hypothetical protein